MFLLTNLYTILGFVLFLIVYLSDIGQHISTTVLVFLSFISLYCNIVFFEYQRITLMIGRYINSLNIKQTPNNIHKIQMLLASPSIGFCVALNSLLFGLIAGVFFKRSILVAVSFIFAKYFLTALAILPIPYKFLFNNITRTLKTERKEIFLKEGGVKMYFDIHTLLTKIPHNKQYEEWIYQKMVVDDNPQDDEINSNPYIIDPIEFPTLVKYDSQKIEEAIQKLMKDRSMTRQQALVNLEQDLSEIEAQIS